MWIAVLILILIQLLQSHDVHLYWKHSYTCIHLGYILRCFHAFLIKMHLNYKNKGIRMRETLESVSLCTRFSGFSTISKFSFNRLSWKLVKLVDMFFGRVLPYDVGPARVFLGEAEKTPTCGLGPASRVKESSNVRSQGFCSASLPRAEMREFRRARTFWRVSARRSNLEQNP